MHTLMMTLAVYADWPIKLRTEYCVIKYKYHRHALMNLLSGITGKSVIFVFLGVYPIVDNFARTSTLRRKESTPKRQYKNLILLHQIQCGKVSRMTYGEKLVRQNE